MWSNIWGAFLVLSVIGMHTNAQDQKTEIIEQISSVIADEAVKASEALVKHPDLDEPTTAEFLKNVSTTAHQKVSPKVQELSYIEASKAVEEAKTKMVEGEQLQIDTQRILKSAASDIQQIQQRVTDKSFEKALESPVLDAKYQKNFKETLNKTLNAMF